MLIYTFKRCIMMKNVRKKNFLYGITKKDWNRCRRNDREN